MNTKRIAMIGLCALSLAIRYSEEANASGTIDVTATSVARNESTCDIGGVVNNDTKYHINSIKLDVTGGVFTIKDVRARAQQGVKVHVAVGRTMVVKDCTEFLTRIIGPSGETATFGECKIGATSDGSEVPEGDCMDMVDPKIRIKDGLQTAAAQLDQTYNERAAQEYTKIAAQADEYVKAGDVYWNLMRDCPTNQNPGDCLKNATWAATWYVRAMKLEALPNGKIKELRARIISACNRIRDPMTTAPDDVFLQICSPTMPTQQ